MIKVKGETMSLSSRLSASVPSLPFLSKCASDPSTGENCQGLISEEIDPHRSQQVTTLFDPLKTLHRVFWVTCII